MPVRTRNPVASIYADCVELGSLEPGKSLVTSNGGKTQGSKFFKGEQCFLSVKTGVRPQEKPVGDMTTEYAKVRWAGI
jgi:hypothetical protein